MYDVFSTGYRDSIGFAVPYLVEEPALREGDVINHYGRYFVITMIERSQKAVYLVDCPLDRLQDLGVSRADRRRHKRLVSKGRRTEPACLTAFH